MPELRGELPYAVEELIDAAEDALESGRTSYNFDHFMKHHREVIVSAGLFDWMSGGTRKYGAPPLLADDPWLAVRTAYNLPDWLDDVLSDREQELLYAPDRAGRLVERFLAECGPRS